jgi:hypothetical protein
LLRRSRLGSEALAGGARKAPKYTTEEEAKNQGCHVY